MDNGNASSSFVNYKRNIVDLYHLNELSKPFQTQKHESLMNDECNVN